MAHRTFVLATRTVDLDARCVEASDTGAKLATLTELEAKLLEFLLDSDGALVPKATLLREVWGYADGVESRAVDYTVRRLRKKIEDDPRSPIHLVSSYGSGVGLQQVTRPTLSSAALETRPPLPIDTFVGRATTLERLDRWIDDGARVVAVTGAGGVGKTRLLLEWSRGRATDALWWVSLGAVADAAALDRAMRDALGTTHSDLDVLLGARDGVVVLDGAEGCIDALAAALSSWTTRAPRLQFVLTTRIPPTLPGSIPLRLEPLSLDSATRLYEARAAGFGALHALDDPDIPRLVARLEGSPLAIELAAARAGVRPVPQLLAALDTPLETLRHPDQPSRSLREVLAWSWSLLTAEQARVLAACSVFPGRFGRDAAEAIAGTEVVQVLDQLRTRSLIQTRAGARRTFSLPMGVRAFAGEQRTSADTKRIDQRLVSWVLQRTGRGRHPPHRAWIIDELELLRGLLGRLQSQGAADATDLAIALAPTLADRGWHQEMLDALAEPAATPGFPAVLRARILGQTGATDAALQSLCASLASPDPILRRTAHITRGGLLLRGTQLEAAAAAFVEAEALLRTHPDAIDRADLHKHRSTMHRIRSEWRLALEHAQACVEIWTRIGDPQGRCDARFEQAMALRGQGKLETARAVLAEVLTYTESVGSMRQLATVHVNMGVILTELGARRLGTHHYEQGLEVHRRTGNLQGQGYAWLNLAWLAHWGLDHTRAEAAMLHARAIGRKVGDQRLAAYADAIDGVGAFLGGDPVAALGLLVRGREALVAIAGPASVKWYATFEAVCRVLLDHPLPPTDPPVAHEGWLAATRALRDGDFAAAHTILASVPAPDRATEGGLILSEWMQRHIGSRTRPGSGERAPTSSA